MRIDSPALLPKNADFGVFNGDPNYLPKWCALRSKLRGGRSTGANRGKIVFVGDSTTVGYGSGSGGADNGAKVYAPPAITAAALSAYGLAAKDGSFLGDSGRGASLATYDTRLSVGAGWAASGSVTAVGGATLENSTTTNALAFTPAFNIDTADMYYVSFVGAAGVTIDFDGGTTTSVDFNAATAIRKATKTGTLGAHTVNIKRTSGDVCVIGLDCYDSTLNHVGVLNGGWYGSQSSQWDVTTARGQLTSLTALAATLYVVCLGINDYANTSDPSSYQTHMASIISTLQATGDVLLVIPPPSDTSVATLAVQAAYAAVMYSLAQTYNVPLIDLRSLFTSYTTGNARGFYFDTKHLTADGSGFWGEAVAKVLAAI